MLRYWEQEFTQLRPMKRRGNRRYYQHHEVLMIRRIRDLLYDQGFTISGARNRMQDLLQTEREQKQNDEAFLEGIEVTEVDDFESSDLDGIQIDKGFNRVSDDFMLLRHELFEIREILSFDK